MTTALPRLLLVTPNFENNSLGRTYCLWLLAKSLGWTVSIVGVKGTAVWGPLRNSAFAADCRLPSVSNLDDRVAEDILAPLVSAASDADLVIAVKPLPTSFGIGRRICAASGTPLLLDVDDPDIEVRTIWRPLSERFPRAIASRRYRSLRRLGRLAATTPTLVSNPVLEGMYGGTVIPHVRPVPVPAPYSSSSAPSVRFVGSTRGHKGVPELRAAVGRLADRGYTLGVTSDAPIDARPWETWYGNTSLEEGQALVAHADIVAIPSLPNSWSPAQLPAKLIDAMMQGRAVVASRTAPIEWALGDTGLLVEPGDVDALTDALSRLGEPEFRADLGARARRRAIELFSIESVSPAFEGAVRNVLPRLLPAERP